MLKRKYNSTIIKRNVSTEGLSIETKIANSIRDKEPIFADTPMIYTDRKDGVNPAYNVRTDRFDIAIEACDKHAKSRVAKREELMKTAEELKQSTDPTILENN